jgi:hypothetical protein
MSSLLTPMCYSCVHFQSPQPDGSLPCEAFPYGIPSDILEGQTDHRQSVEGDDGIVFEQREGAEEPPFGMYPFAQPVILSSLRSRVHGDRDTDTDTV